MEVSNEPVGMFHLHYVILIDRLPQPDPQLGGFQGDNGLESKDLPRGLGLGQVGGL